MLFFNVQDVGLAILESYSRILESLAHKVLSRIEDVQHADALTQSPSSRSLKMNSLRDSSRMSASGKFEFDNMRELCT